MNNNLPPRIVMKFWMKGKNGSYSTNIYRLSELKKKMDDSNTLVGEETQTHDILFPITPTVTNDLLHSFFRALLKSILY